MSISSTNTPIAAVKRYRKLSPIIGFNWDSQICGKNVQIARPYQAYRKPDCKDQAYIFFSQPLKLGWKIGLEVTEVTNESWENLVYGVTSCNPANLKQSEFPKDPNALVDRPEYWIVKHDSNFYQKRDVITFVIDLEGKLSVHKNKNKFASFHVDPTQQLWLFFNIAGWVSGLRIMGAKPYTEIVAEVETLKVSDKDDPGPSNQQESSECVICCEGPVDCVLYRCGHMCMCYKCALKVWRPGTKSICPLCRKEILDVIKFYK